MRVTPDALLDSSQPQGIRSTQTAATLLYSSFRMPLSDFKCLQSGQNVVWTLYYDQTEQTFLRDQASMRLATERLLWEYGRPEMYGTVVWCKTESGIQTVKDILSKEVLEFESCSKLRIAKELCVFDGVSLHSHTGQVWTLEDVESCIGYLEKNSSPQAVLKLLGKKRRQTTSAWRQFSARILKNDLVTRLERQAMRRGATHRALDTLAVLTASYVEPSGQPRLFYQKSEVCG
ncbi:hypothetical protein WJX82_006387 [Trebouxia sp. C0006]